MKSSDRADAIPAWSIRTTKCRRIALHSLCYMRRSCRNRIRRRGLAQTSARNGDRTRSDGGNIFAAEASMIATFLRLGSNAWLALGLVVLVAAFAAGLIPFSIFWLVIGALTFYVSEYG